MKGLYIKSLCSILNICFFTIQTCICRLYLRYPRHRKLISINKIYTGRQNGEFNLRHDWNSLLSHRPDLLFQRFSRDLYPEADAFPRYLSVFEKELGLQVKYNTDIGSIRASQFGESGHKGYILTDQHGMNYKCRYCGSSSSSLWTTILFPNQACVLCRIVSEFYRSVEYSFIAVGSFHVFLCFFFFCVTIF